MAASWDPEISEYLKCALCLDTYRVPKDLPCHHTFCLDCINKYILGSHRAAWYPCPVCRRLFSTFGARRLPTNHMAQGLAELKRMRTAGRVDTGSTEVAGEAGRREQSNDASNGQHVMNELDRHMEVTQDHPDTLTLYPRDHHATIVIMTGGVSVQGVSIVDDMICVIEEDESEVVVYDTHSLASLRKIDVPDMRIPNSITGCVLNKALYIVDWAPIGPRYCIHRVDLTNNSVTLWMVRKEYFPKGLSVTAEHNVLVTVTDQEEVSGVLEYTTEGEQVREIRFDESIWYAHQTVQLSSNKFFVCNGLDYGSLHRVCEVNAEGKIINSYGGEARRCNSNSNEIQGKLVEPLSLTIDNNRRRIFVADSGNHRVVSFDFNLTYRGQVHIPFDLKDPCCLDFDSSTDRLFVGDNSGRVIVISL